jgi:hypothetical protein
MAWWWNVVGLGETVHLLVWFARISALTNAAALANRCQIGQIFLKPGGNVARIRRRVFG